MLILLLATVYLFAIYLLLTFAPRLSKMTQSTSTQASQASSVR